MRNQNRARNNMTALCIAPTYLTQCEHLTTPLHGDRHSTDKHYHQDTESYANTLQTTISMGYEITIHVSQIIKIEIHLTPMRMGKLQHGYNEVTKLV